MWMIVRPLGLVKPQVRGAEGSMRMMRWTVTMPVAASSGIPDFAFLVLLAGMTRGPSVMMIEGR